jgi:hypothetical protein
MTTSKTANKLESLIFWSETTLHVSLSYHVLHQSSPWPTRRALSDWHMYRWLVKSSHDRLSWLMSWRSKTRHRVPRSLMDCRPIHYGTHIFSHPIITYSYDETALGSDIHHISMSDKPICGRPRKPRPLITNRPLRCWMKTSLWTWSWFSICDQGDMRQQFAFSVTWSEGWCRDIPCPCGICFCE